MLQVGSAVGAAEKLPDGSGHGETEGRPVVFLRTLLILLAVIGILTLLQGKLGYYDVHVPKAQYSTEFMRNLFSSDESNPKAWLKMQSPKNFSR